MSDVQNKWSGVLDFPNKMVQNLKTPNKMVRRNLLAEKWGKRGVVAKKWGLRGLGAKNRSTVLGLDVHHSLNRSPPRAPRARAEDPKGADETAAVSFDPYWSPLNCVPIELCPQ